MGRRDAPLLFFLSLLAASACTPADRTGEIDDVATVAPLLVLAASDLQLVLTEIRDLYVDRTATGVDLVFGSTGNLTTQIEQGAPADVFFAANEEFVDRLIAGGHVDADSRLVYGIGRIVIVTAPGVPLPASIEALLEPTYGTIAIANPEHAPYGRAAREAMQSSGIWSEAERKLVFGENIAQVLQFVRTGNADAGIVALGLVLGASPHEHLLIDETYHSELRQAAGVLTESRNPARAQAFLDFVAGSQGRALLARYGFAPSSEG